MSEQRPPKEEQPTQPEPPYTEPAQPGRVTEGTNEQRTAPPAPATQSAPVLDEGVVWVRIAPSQVVRTITIALLTAAVVLGALFLLWQVRTIIGWGVLALFLAVVLNPVVDWLHRRGIGRSIGILLTYLGVVAALLLIAGIFVPVVVNEIRDLIDFVVAVVQDPSGVTEDLRTLLEQLRLGFLFDTLSERLAELPSQLADLARSFLLSAGGLAVSAATFVSAIVTILTIAFFLLLNPEGFVNVGLRLFAEPQRPRVRRLLRKSARAVSGYITGNLAISFICGVVTFVVLLVLGMPYPAALALLVAVLDLIPLVGATLGGALLVIVGFRQPADGPDPAHLHPHLPAGGGQHPSADGLQSRRPVARAADLRRRAGRRGATRHTRGAAGHPGGGDNPDIRDRSGRTPLATRRGRGSSQLRTE